MLGVIVTTYFTEVFHMTLLTGLPFLGLLALVYALWYRPRAQAARTAPKE
ncbi:MAG: amino acid permease, partial [Delftia sp.]|nr:amino acid permease [Delftia sp.]